MRSLFADVRFRRLFAAQVVALAGTGLTTVALGLLAYDLAGERAALVLGSALTVKMVAYVLVGPVVGAIADRVPRRRLMLAANLVRAGVVLALPGVTALWQVFVLIGVLQVASATFTPVFQSVLPDIITDEQDYTRALSAAQLASSLETVLSPLLAAAALLVVGYSSLFVGTAVGFAVAAVLVAVTVVPPVAQRAPGGFGTRLLLGVRLFRAVPQLRGLLALNAVVATVGVISLVTTVNVVRDLLGGTDAEVGLLLAVSGAGTAVAAACTPWFARRAPMRTVMLAGAGVSLGAAAATVMLGLYPSWTVAVFAWALVGLGPGWIMVSTGRLLRVSAGPGQRPALFSAQFSLSHACWLLTYPLTGWLTVAVGLTGTWLVLAVLAVLGTGAAAALWPRTDADLIRHRHDDDVDHDHVARADRTARGWTHSHRLVVDERHPHGPVPA
ncbi:MULTISPECIES: MFS transporter [Pseudonocardia]|uniref:Major Facilitator Superfamily protein n=2 Tax=Pseudonocardia TaxID=1847 RepID=A0A1Y2MT83_PSEAH|nr:MULTISPECIES: MFS transporter [Pseudonocardia]OSY38361.1 Major Facilitator Superfamily protein [Pseudonocardia autotrophica]TDN72594.1 putative MFS family arabinose efflux permease [Pseudonocardia autotrophica]BBG03303.1 MFS transporter [Pseudonocardia autotrophica]GEC24561.1 MFS transporter [Pseudonocardia saturnea]